jgi:7,8-dihydroneopterin aldolase/epimerase/oxygenase
MDYIHIDKLFFSGKHGVYAKERRLEQEFEISLRLTFDTSVSAKSDKLKDTVDYQRVKNIVEKAITGGSRYLVEKLGEEIALQILEDKRIGRVEVTIKKTAVWDNGVPGVTIIRDN